jgi:hypothetical protein
MKPNKELSALLYSLEIPLGVWVGLLLSQNKWFLGASLTVCSSLAYYYAALMWPTPKVKDGDEK